MSLQLLLRTLQVTIIFVCSHSGSFSFEMSNRMERSSYELNLTCHIDPNENISIVVGLDKALRSYQDEFEKYRTANFIAIAFDVSMWNIQYFADDGIYLLDRWAWVNGPEGESFLTFMAVNIPFLNRVSDPITISLYRKLQEFPPACRLEIVYQVESLITAQSSDKNGKLCVRYYSTTDETDNSFFWYYWSYRCVENECYQQNFNISSCLKPASVQKNWMTVFGIVSLILMYFTLIFLVPLLPWRLLPKDSHFLRAFKTNNDEIIAFKVEDLLPDDEEHPVRIGTTFSHWQYVANKPSIATPANKRCCGCLRKLWRAVYLLAPIVVTLIGQNFRPHSVVSRPILFEIACMHAACAVIYCLFSFLFAFFHKDYLVDTVTECSAQRPSFFFSSMQDIYGDFISREKIRKPTRLYVNRINMLAEQQIFRFWKISEKNTWTQFGLSCNTFLLIPLIILYLPSSYVLINGLLFSFCAMFSCFNTSKLKWASTNRCSLILLLMAVMWMYVNLVFLAFFLSKRAQWVSVTAILNTDISVSVLVCVIFGMYYVIDTYYSFTDYYYQLKLKAFEVVSSLPASRCATYVSDFRYEEVRESESFFEHEAIFLKNAPNIRTQSIRNYIPVQLFRLICDQVQPVNKSFIKNILKVLLIAFSLLLIVAVMEEFEGTKTNELILTGTFALLPKIFTLYLSTKKTNNSSVNREVERRIQLIISEFKARNRRIMAVNQALGENTPLLSVVVE